MSESFVTWLVEQIDSRGWTNSELARRANLVPSTVSMVVSHQKRPGLEFCVGIAQAFGVPPEDVLRLAGLLPSIPAPIAEEHEVVTILRSLPAAIRRTVVTMLRALTASPGPRVPETPPYDLDDQYIPELLAEFEQLPEDWKPVIVQQIHQFARMAGPARPRLIGEEEPERETERHPQED